jgi:hypothetical protein
LIFYITLERSKTRQDKFESILEIIESVVFSSFVKAEADLVESVQGKSRSISGFAEKSGDNHPKHFRKIIM